MSNQSGSAKAEKAVFMTPDPNLPALYLVRDADCRFCNPPPMERYAGENELAYARKDLHPVVPGHTLILPKRHVASYGDLEYPEIQAMHELMNQIRAELKAADASIEGFNIGVNDGEVAGQSIFHVHMHIIPRRPGDGGSDKGGVRHIIAGKGNY